jgi:hypothetical protein
VQITYYAPIHKDMVTFGRPMSITVAKDGMLPAGEDSSEVIYGITGSAPSRQACYASLGRGEMSRYQSR